MSGVTQERWDVALVILSGPLRSNVEHVYRGPIVRIGHNPGPGGVQLTGYRGLDARQCTITAYDGGSAEVSPVGTNQVRIAPHANVNWNNIDPINGPTFLSNGCALHIGPVGRGATLQFVECRRLGVWEGGAIRSEYVAQDNQLGAGVPTAYDAKRVGRIQVSMVPAWFIGCLGLTLGSTAFTVLAAALIVIVGNRDVVDLGPVDDDYEYFKSVDMTKPPDAKLLKGLEQPMLHWVMRPNMDAAGGRHPELEDPKTWDRTFMRYVTRSVELHVKQKPFFKNLDDRRAEWAIVLKEMRRAGLPEVFAAIPYQESRYRSDAQSYVCAKGPWQFMPETAHRVDQHYNSELRVQGCRLRGRPSAWSPKDFTPPFTSQAPYVEDEKCLITSCDVDDRSDLRKSTAGAVLTLKEAWDDPLVAESGAAVQVTILSHNAGADDSKWGKRKATNLIPALRTWIAKNGAQQGPAFYGNNILCETHNEKKLCGSLLMPETQHYAYNIVAQHIIAVCYYSKEYAHEPEFAPWAPWALDDAYCSQFTIPSKVEVKGWQLKKRAGEL
ncbi:MAG: transglycosylase SLT domain-containing protein [Alphaproteobacteria bacterium]|nr:transglycosylase SLT domain-containing protein [Alphaproteobacteria bacterium]MCB9691688.1 transglycosylase SLT domain-containing protein [Alphaproteobacteria bacterium]